MQYDKTNTPWKVLGDELIAKTRVFDLRSRKMLFPDGKTADDFYYIRSPEWTNVIPVTPRGEVVLVRQFRHGVQDYCLETPGGLVDEHETDIAASALRELEEETGYVPEKMLSLGSVHPNPATIDNRCHFFLATGVEKKKELDLDASEDITVHPIPLRELGTMFRRGELMHSLLHTALFLASLHYPEIFRPLWEDERSR